MRKSLSLLFLSIFCLLPLTVSAQSVDLIWEGGGYVPPFYQGGAPWGKDGMIHFLAIPQGLGNTRNLNFKWSQNGTVLGSLSGVGVNTLNLKDSIFSKPQNIVVEVADSNDATLAANGVIVVPAAPRLLIYEKSPLYGFLFNHEVGGAYTPSDPEVTLGAFPFLFETISSLSSQMQYSWQSGSGTDSSGQTVVYRVPDGATGQASVSVSASNSDSLTEQAGRNFLIQFKSQ